MTVVPKEWIRFDTEDNIYFRGQKCTVFTEKDQDKYGVGYYGPRWDLRFPLSKENWSEPSCARVSDKLPVEPDGSYLNLRDGPGTEFKVKVKLSAGTDLNLDGVSQDGKWKHVRSAVIKGKIYSGWVREKFVLDQPCKTSKTSETATPPTFKPALTDKPWSGEKTKVDPEYLKWLEKNPSFMPLEMKDADWCQKRDHKDPACVVESKIGKGRDIKVDGVPLEIYERPTECPKWLGLDC